MRLNDLDQTLQGPLWKGKRYRLEKQRNCIAAGEAGEKEAAYHIDFHLKDHPNWAVVHDLRLEWNGRVAQIDHLLINLKTAVETTLRRTG